MRDMRRGLRPLTLAAVSIAVAAGALPATPAPTAAGPITAGACTDSADLHAPAPGPNLRFGTTVAGKVFAPLAGASGCRPGSDLRPRSRRTRQAMVESAKEELAAPGSEDLTLGDLAARVHSSPHHLAHVFRAATGFTLHRYRLELRLRESAALIGRRALPDVATSTGFRTHSHFARQFKKTFGTTPSRVAAPASPRAWLDLAHECLAATGGSFRP